MGVLTVIRCMSVEVYLDKCVKKFNNNYGELQTTRIVRIIPNDVVYFVSCSYTIVSTSYYRELYIYIVFIYC